MKRATRFKLLSIDAWKDYDSWTWNQWYTLDDNVLLDAEVTNRGILKYLRNEGYLTNNSKGKVSIDDDGYNITVMDKNNRMPLFALCYGEYL